MKASNKSFKKRVRNAFIVLLAIVFILYSGAIFLAILFVRNSINDSNLKLTSQIAETSLNANDEQARNGLIEVTRSKARNVNSAFFSKLETSALIIKGTAENLYENPEEYGSITVNPPSMDEAGILALQVTYSPGVDPEDPRIAEEQALLGNLGGLLMSINETNASVTSVYIATESGFMIQADSLAEYQFDEHRNVMPFEARQRPWYLGAVENEGLFYSGILHDIATGKQCIVCSVPVYSKEKLMGVVGIGMLLDELNAATVASHAYDNVNEVIVNQDGDVICSTVLEGDFAFNADDPVNLLSGSNAGLSSMLRSVLNSNQQEKLDVVEVDGEKQYVTCVRIEKADWFYISAVPEASVYGPTQKLEGMLRTYFDEMLSDTDSYMWNALLMSFLITIVLFVLAGLMVRKVSYWLITPINRLSEMVKTLDGDNLQFEWKQTTGDEIDLLATTFCHLTKRIQDYIRDITIITAEKERIGAELSVATQIQADMLPIVFPPFPERKEFEIFASMTPAKEVGGDFYDFFMLDDDHLAMVIADVSGKGVPAALFMVISKTLIKDHAQMCGSPKAILEKVNDLLIESNAEGMFVTVWLGILEISTGKIVAANAGHEYPSLRTADGKFELLKDKHGMMVGAMNGIRYKEYEMQLEKGGCLFVYTDGVPEATNANNELYGTDRMLDALNQDPHTDPKTLLSNVRADVDRFVGDAPQFDDLTMLSLLYYGPVQESEKNPADQDD